MIQSSCIILQNAEELKEKGNACVKEGRHHEAVIYYSQAISSDPNNSILFSKKLYIMDCCVILINFFIPE